MLSRKAWYIPPIGPETRRWASYVMADWVNGTPV
jgi:hypothetical protein